MAEEKKTNYPWIVTMENLSEVIVVAKRHGITDDGSLLFDAWLPDGTFASTDRFAPGTWRRIQLGNGPS